MLVVPNGTLISVPIVTPGSNAYRSFPATTTLRRGRVYLFHGLGNGQSGIGLQWTQNGIGGAYLTTIQSLNADGWECIVAPEPYDFVDSGPPVYNGKVQTPVWWDMRDDPLLGGRIVATTLASFDNLVARVNADLGWLPPVVGGVSWGAWSSLQIVANRPVLRDGTPIGGFFTINTPSIFGNLTTDDSPIYVPNSTNFMFPFSTSGADLATVAGGPLVGGPFGTYTSTFLNACRIPGRVTFNSEDFTVFPGGCSVMVQSAIAAGAPLQGRTITDGIITGGTSLSSATFCSGGANENGAVITGPGIPVGTTISGITDTGTGPPTGTSGTSGPWTMTLSQVCTNGSALSCAFPGLAPSYNNIHIFTTQNGLDLVAWFASVLDLSHPAVN